MTAATAKTTTVGRLRGGEIVQISGETFEVAQVSRSDFRTNIELVLVNDRGIFEADAPKTAQITRLR